ncbi:MAG TPA: class I SAM-dependent rRNA methyltransferase [Acidobacteriaceae bacterium]|nr:class I SAM-dependent rRNA methyltransferase [Acidobacteriaceae bacterium]
MTTQAGEKREGTMPPKAGRAKTGIQAMGRSKGRKAGTDGAAESVVKAAAKLDTTVWPVGRISRRAAARVRAGHPWVYQSDVEEIIAEPGQDGVAPGSLVTVIDERGVELGTAIYSDASLITLRMVTQELIEDRVEFLELVRHRLRRAVQMRLNGLQELRGTNACRLVFGEADELPGIVADRYGELVILQLLTQGTHVTDVRAVVVDVFREMLEPATIVERPDARIRELEQLEAPSTEPLYSGTAEKPMLETIFELNGLRFHFDANAGQKTGAFLDQRENYLAAESYARGRVLDVCTYQGGFALHLARRCSRVTGVDASRAALEVAEENLHMNRDQLVGQGSGVEWIEANAFDLLRDWSDTGEEFDTIVLDPPAFAKSKRAVEGALRGYKEMNLRALKMLRPGGRLVTCSCSHHVPLVEFQAVVAEAASDAGKRVRLLEIRGAAFDHPAILTIPETQYLKCLICEVD